MNYASHLNNGLKAPLIKKWGHTQSEGQFVFLKVWFIFSTSTWYHIIVEFFMSTKIHQFLNKATTPEQVCCHHDLLITNLQIPADIINARFFFCVATISTTTKTLQLYIKVQDPFSMHVIYAPNSGKQKRKKPEEHK